MTTRSKRMRGLRLLVFGAAAALLLAACAQGSGAGGGGEAAGSTGPTASAPTSTTAPGGTPVPTSTAAPSPAPTGGAGTNVVVRGTVRQGVEPGCLLLDAQDKRAYLLLDADPSTVKPGARVEVVGQPADQIVSFCGEGTALSVVSARPLR